MSLRGSAVEARGCFLIQTHGQRAASNEYVCTICWLGELFQESYQRIITIRVQACWTCGAHFIDIFLAGKKAQQDFLIAYAGSAEFSPQLLQRHLRQFTSGDFIGATPAEDFVLYVGIHQCTALFSPHAQGVLDALVGDFLVPLANDYIDGGLAADELG